ncbi:MAG: hypothetical protein HOJ70_05095 [Microbacteriaceae bacterium]|nr:hypothetical protein [Microbacteriaceae bacterium]MBT7803543.1 hypothetical protein [Microbacteriaceae bacterium]
MLRSRHYLRRWSQLLSGLFLFGFSAAMMLRANIGVDPWTVFAEGFNVRWGFSFGWVIVISGLAVLLIWIPLRQRPGIGTILNALLVGPSMEVGLALVETPETLPQRIVLFASGLLMMGIASGLYIGARFGPGPRDGLMVGFNARFGWPMWAVRTGVESTVLAIGWALGGTFGVGTIVFAVLIGPLAQRAIIVFRVPDYLTKSTGT